MIVSFALVNLKGMEGLLSGVLRCYRLCQLGCTELWVSCSRRVPPVDPIECDEGQGVAGHTTMRVSLGLLAVTENALVCGRATRDADRDAVRIKNGESLLAMAVGEGQWRRQLRASHDPDFDVVECLSKLRQLVD